MVAGMVAAIGTASRWTLANVSLGGRLRAVDLDLPREPIAVLGASGAGKSTLLNLLVGFERPTSGMVHFHHEATESEHELPLFWVPQDLGLWPHLTVLEHLELVSDEETAAEVLRLLELEGLEQRAIDEISGGERARLAVGRGMAACPRVLVMDEPLTNVELTRQRACWKQLTQWCERRGIQLVFATHQQSFALSYAQTAICLENGELVFQGPIQELYESPPDETTARFLGEVNWLTDAEVEAWEIESDASPLGPVETPCVRPGRLEIDVAEESHIRVTRVRSHGVVTELTLQHDGNEVERDFFSSRVPNKLEAGMAVRLRLLSLLALLLMVVGCSQGESGPRLKVTQQRTWVLPAAGSVVPAPRAIVTNAKDELFVLDTAGRVVVFDVAGELLRKWNMPDAEVGNPEGILVLRDGRIAVADTHYHQVVIFSSVGDVEEIWGSKGKGPGEFGFPVALAQDDSGHVYVGEYDNGRVQKFDAEGDFVLEFGRLGTEPGEFQRPSGLAWRDGKLIVADAFNNRLQVFRDDGTFERGISVEASPFYYPYDLALGPENDFYVVEYGAGRVTRLRPDGTMVGRIGGIGSSDNQFVTPWGLTVDRRGHIFVADTGNRRIVEFAP